MNTLCCVAACSLLILSCGERDNDRGRAAPTPLELATIWAGARNQVVPYVQVEVPGYELFWVSTPTPHGPPAGFGVAVPIDEQNFLEGKGALRALFARGVDDPMDMARLSLLFLERGGVPLPGPRTDEHRQFGVSPPQVESGVLSFWYERRSDAFVELLRAELMLDTLEHHTRSIHLQELVAPHSGARPAPEPHGH